MINYKIKVKIIYGDYKMEFRDLYPWRRKLLMMNKPVITIVCDNGGCGKTTMARWLCEKYPHKYYYGGDIFLSSKLICNAKQKYCVIDTYFDQDHTFEKFMKKLNDIQISRMQSDWKLEPYKIIVFCNYPHGFYNMGNLCRIYEIDYETKDFITDGN